MPDLSSNRFVAKPPVFVESSKLAPLIFMSTKKPPLQLSTSSPQYPTGSPALPRSTMPMHDYLKLDESSRRIFRMLGGKVKL